MVFPKASAPWKSRAFTQSAKSTKPRLRSRTWQKYQRRSYASGGESGSGTHRSAFMAGDWPWALGSGIISIPSIWYLAQPQIKRYTGKGDSHGGHGHEDDKHDEHAEGDEHEGEKGGEGDDNEADEDKGEPNDEGSEGHGDEGDDSIGDKPHDQDSASVENEDREIEQDKLEEDSDGTEGQSNSKDDENQRIRDPKFMPLSPHDKQVPEKVEVDSGDEVEGVKFKGSVAGKPNHEQTDTRYRVPDAKGGNKKRAESDYGERQGLAENPEEDDSNEDKPASSKSVNDPTHQTMAGKQEGLANTDTKHSWDLANDPSRSKKGEGVPETAKLKGTVDPRRPQA